MARVSGILVDSDGTGEEATVAGVMIGRRATQLAFEEAVLEPDDFVQIKDVQSAEMLELDAIAALLQDDRHLHELREWDASGSDDILSFLEVVEES